MRVQAGDYAAGRAPGPNTLGALLGLPAVLSGRIVRRVAPLEEERWRRFGIRFPAGSMRCRTCSSSKIWRRCFAARRRRFGDAWARVLAIPMLPGVDKRPRFSRAVVEAHLARGGKKQLTLNTVPARSDSSVFSGGCPHASPYCCRHQITPKTSRYTRCSMSMLPNVSINRRTRSSGQLGRWWYSISPCRNNECVRRFTVFAFNQRS